MDVILPVAGLGTRLRPQTWSKPKPLVSLAGKTILEHVLDRVLPTHPEQIVFITGYLGSHIEAWSREHITIPTAFVKQTEMRGQTDAIIRARDISRDDALILFPDMLFEADFSVIDRSDADVIMFTKEVEDPSALGIAVVENGQIVKLVEKPKELISKLAVIGIYYIRSMPALYEAIDEQMERGIKTRNEYFIADAIQIMIDKGAKVISAPVTLGRIAATRSRCSRRTGYCWRGTRSESRRAATASSFIRRSSTNLRTWSVRLLARSPALARTAESLTRWSPTRYRGRRERRKLATHRFDHRVWRVGVRPADSISRRREHDRAVTTTRPLVRTDDMGGQRSDRIGAELFARYGYNEGVSIEEPFLQEQDGDNLRIDISKPAVIRTYIPAESYDPATVDRIRDGLWHLGQMRSVGELTVTERSGRTGRRPGRSTTGRFVRVIAS